MTRCFTLVKPVVEVIVSRHPSAETTNSGAGDSSVSRRLFLVSISEIRGISLLCGTGFSPRRVQDHSSEVPFVTSHEPTVTKGSWSVEDEHEPDALSLPVLLRARTISDLGEPIETVIPSSRYPLVSRTLINSQPFRSLSTRVGEKAVDNGVIMLD